MSALSRYERTIALRKSGTHFKDTNLAPQFIDAYNRGDKFRIKVDLGYRQVWGFVGMTTGWGPSFILLRHRGQKGSSELLQFHHKILESRWLTKEIALIKTTERLTT